MYKNGLYLKKDYLKAKEYFECAAALGFSKSYVSLGDLYKHGLGVVQSYEKAKGYYEVAAKNNDSNSFLCLGSLYFNGFGVVKDYLRAKYDFELAAEKSNSDSLINLGLMYLNGYGVEKDISKAVKYLAESSNLKNDNAYFYLGTIYLNVYKNYLKAKNSFELAAFQNNSNAILSLGYLYFCGFGVTKDYLKSIQYLELSAKQNNSTALFILGRLYSTGEIVEINFEKSINYFKKCVEIHRGIYPSYNSFDNSFLHSYKYNPYYYHSCNELGLIYIKIYNDIGKADEYLKIAGFNGYSFGQNSYGVLNQFYLKNTELAQHMYESASKQHFALAYYNLGYLMEEKNLIDECIKYYIQASNDEDESFIFLKKKYFDVQLEISKLFIICLTNLTLTHFYLTINNFEKSKKYFIKSLAKIKSSNKYYNFKFKFDLQKNDIFSPLRLFILNFPFFNLKNQSNIYLDDSQNENEVYYKTNTLIEIYCLKQQLNDHKIDNFETENPEELFDLVIKNKELKCLFELDIKLIIITMKKILYTPPYSILFGKIDIEQPKKEVETFFENINELFYEGFDLEN